MPEVRSLPSAGITRPQRSYEPVRRPSSRHLDCGVRGGEPRSIGPPPITRVALPACCAHYPGGSERVRLSGFLPRSVLPSPLPSRVGIRIATFEACSSFTRYGPLARSAAQGSLCHRAPVRSLANRLSATRSNRLLSRWNLPPPATRAYGAHWAKARLLPSPPTRSPPRLCPRRQVYAV